MIVTFVRLPWVLKVPAQGWVFVLLSPEPWFFFSVAEGNTASTKADVWCIQAVHGVQTL